MMNESTSTEAPTASATYVRMGISGGFIGGIASMTIARKLTTPIMRGADDDLAGTRV